MIGNNPSYIIPREFIDYKTSFDMIEELTARYVDERNKFPNSHLEIEVKTGYLLFGRDQHTENFKTLLHSLSYKDFVIVGVRSNRTNIQSYFGSRDFVGENYQLQPERWSKKRFNDVKNYFEREHTQFPGKIKEGKSDFSIDFAMADGSRVTYSFRNQDWKRIKKNERSSIDILHKSFPYRISYAFEETLDFNPEEFLKTTVRSIRIKDRKSWNLEYMEYSLTETVQYEQGANNLEDMKTKFYLNKAKIEQALEWLAAKQLRTEEEYEMEVEVVDVELFAKSLGRPDFSSYLKRFIRNAEGVFLIPHVFNESLAIDFCKNNKMVMPKIGQYFSEIYLEKIQTKK